MRRLHAAKDGSTKVQVDGKFAGTIGKGKDHLPTAAPEAQPALLLTDTPATPDIDAQFAAFKAATAEPAVSDIDDHLLERVLKMHGAAQAELMAAQHAEPNKELDPDRELPIWSEVDEYLMSELDRLELREHFNLHHLEKGMVGARSVAGTHSADLLRAFADVLAYDNRATLSHGGYEGPGLLVDYRTDTQFQTEITGLRALNRALVKNADAAVLSGEDDSQAFRDGIDRVAREYRIDREYVERLANSDAALSVTYPDSASFFSDGRIVIAEHKLSGSNDSKAVSKNLEELERMRALMGCQEHPVTTAVALPFTSKDKYYAARWGNHDNAPDAVLSHEETWSGLFGRTISRDQFERVVEGMAPAIAHRAMDTVIKGLPDDVRARYTYSLTNKRFELIDRSETQQSLF